MSTHNPNPIKFRGAVLSDVTALADLSDWPKGTYGDRLVALENTLHDTPQNVLVAVETGDPVGYIRHSVEKDGAEGFVRIEDFFATTPGIKELLFKKFCKTSREVEAGLPLYIEENTPELGRLGFQPIGNANAMTMPTNRLEQMRQNMELPKFKPMAHTPGLSNTQMN